MGVLKLLCNGRWHQFLQILHTPLLQELKDRAGLAPDTDVRHQSQVLHQAHSMTLWEGRHPLIFIHSIPPPLSLPLPSPLPLPFLSLPPFLTPSAFPYSLNPLLKLSTLLMFTLHFKSPIVCIPSSFLTTNPPNPSSSSPRVFRQGISCPSVCCGVGEV